MSDDTPVTEEAPVQVIPFDTALMRKDDMSQHLWETHGIDPWAGYGGTKRTKDQLVVLHMDHHDAEAEGRSRRPIKVPHTHTALPEHTAAQRAALDRAENPLGKALNTTERRALQELVNNDFAVLRTEIDQFANDMLQQRLAEIEVEYADKEDEMRRFIQQARDLQAEIGRRVEAFNAQSVKEVQAMKDEAKAKGFTLSLDYRLAGPSGWMQEPTAELSGKKDAINKAKAEVEADKQRARNTLERQRLTNQRKVLMLGVSQPGLEVLDELPDARTMMLQAASERPAVQQIDA